jgi:hypothetical protein
MSGPAGKYYQRNILGVRLLLAVAAGAVHVAQELAELSRLRAGCIDDGLALFHRLAVRRAAEDTIPAAAQTLGRATDPGGARIRPVPQKMTASRIGELSRQPLDLPPKTNPSRNCSKRVIPELRDGDGANESATIRLRHYRNFPALAAFTHPLLGRLALGGLDSLGAEMIKTDRMVGFIKRPQAEIDRLERKYDRAKAAWEKRKQGEQQRCGYVAANRASEDACGRSSQAIDERRPSPRTATATPTR